MEARSQEMDRTLALLEFTRKLSAMINFGVHLARCNWVISKDGPAPYDDFCRALQERWERNDNVTLSDAMSERLDLFSPFYVSIIRWGEVGGILEESFAQLTDILELACKMWSRTGRQAEWGWLLQPTDQPVLRDWNELDTTHKTLVLMLFTRALGMMLSAGVPFTTALDTAVEFIPGAQREEFRRGSQQSIEENKSWSAYLATTDIAPEFLTTLVSIGETGGVLDITLERVALVYQQQLECELM